MPFVGRKLRLKILEVNRKANRLILSEKVALYEERREKRDELFSSLQVGQKVTGTVRSIAPFGVFIDLGGIDGLVHKSELSWNKVNNPESGYKVGEEVEAEVIDINHERGRISLSIRRLQPDPWHSTVADFNVGDVIDGTVTKLVNFGAFVRVRDGLEGLIHISELSHQRVAHPGDVVHEGQALKLKIISLDSERHRLGLSLKQAEEAAGSTGNPRPVSPASAGPTGARRRPATRASTAPRAWLLDVGRGPGARGRDRQHAGVRVRPGPRAAGGGRGRRRRRVVDRRRDRGRSRRRGGGRRRGRGETAAASSAEPAATADAAAAPKTPRRPPSGRRGRRRGSRDERRPRRRGRGRSRGRAETADAEAAADEARREAEAAAPTEAALDGASRSRAAADEPRSRAGRAEAADAEAAAPRPPAAERRADAPSPRRRRPTPRRGAASRGQPAEARGTRRRSGGQTAEARRPPDGRGRARAAEPTPRPTPPTGESWLIPSSDWRVAMPASDCAARDESC